MELAKKYEKLYKSQDEILNILAKSGCGLYLSGGTALNRFILNGYRYSDDLDLYTIDTSMKTASELNNFIEILYLEGVKFDIKVNSHSFKRLHLPKSNLKIDLIHERLRHIGDYKQINGFLLDNIKNIFINKLDASYGRNEIRDYFDLYIILKNFDFNLLESYEDLKLKSENSLEDICSNIRAFCEEEMKNIANKNNLPIKNPDIYEDFMQNGQAFLKKYFSPLEDEKSIQRYLK